MLGDYTSWIDSLCATPKTPNLHQWCENNRNEISYFPTILSSKKHRQSIVKAQREEGLDDEAS